MSSWFHCFSGQNRTIVRFDVKWRVFSFLGRGPRLLSHLQWRPPLCSPVLPFSFFPSLSLPLVVFFRFAPFSILSEYPSFSVVYISSITTETLAKKLRLFSSIFTPNVCICAESETSIRLFADEFGPMLCLTTTEAQQTNEYHRSRRD